MGGLLVLVRFRRPLAYKGSASVLTRHVTTVVGSRVSILESVAVPRSLTAPGK
jgi:hypothetical protein